MVHWTGEGVCTPSPTVAVSLLGHGKWNDCSDVGRHRVARWATDPLLDCLKELFERIEKKYH